MSTFNFNYIFKDAFGTFKVFETIPIEISGILTEGHSKTIWQTLNHLIIWRTHLLHKLTNIESNTHFNESKSWSTQYKPINRKQWNSKLNEFNLQSTEIKAAINNLNFSDLNLEEKLKLLLDSSTHLSFHLGEIILISRQKNKYPQPSEMKEFLRE